MGAINHTKQTYRGKFNCSSVSFLRTSSIGLRKVIALRSVILHDDGTSLASSITRLVRGKSNKLVCRVSPNIKLAMTTERLALFAELNALAMLLVAE